MIGFSQGTVSKELSRNCGKSGYRPKEADRLSLLRFRAKRPRGKVVAGEVRTEVEARLRIKHSPEQISGKLAKRGVSVSPGAIYSHVESDKKDGGDLWKHLRINGRRRYPEPIPIRIVYLSQGSIFRNTRTRSCHRSRSRCEIAVLTSASPSLVEHVVRSQSGSGVFEVGGRRDRSRSAGSCDHHRLQPSCGSEQVATDALVLLIASARRGRRTRCQRSGTPPGR